MKQTAVEWLIGQLENHYVKQDLKNTIVYQQAKEMEKEQIMDAYWDAYKENQYSGDKVAEEYYKETYEKSNI